MFFEKVQVILKRLPIYLKQIDIERNQERNHLFNFFRGLDIEVILKTVRKLGVLLK